MTPLSAQIFGVLSASLLSFGAGLCRNKFESECLSETVHAFHSLTWLSIATDAEASAEEEGDAGAAGGKKQPGATGTRKRKELSKSTSGATARGVKEVATSTRVMTRSRTTTK